MPPRHALVLVTFDHSHGPVVASVHGALKPSAAVLDLLGLAALPDSEEEGSDGLGTQLLTFYVERAGLWGFSLYRAVREEGQSRGARQSAVVLLAERPYLDLYRRAVARIGEAYYRVGSTALAGAEEQLAGWLARGAARPARPLPGHNVVEAAATAAEAAGLDEATRAARHGSFAPAHCPSVVDQGFGLDACFGPDAYAQLLTSGLAPSCWRLWQLFITGAPHTVHPHTTHHTPHTTHHTPHTTPHHAY